MAKYSYHELCNAAIEGRRIGGWQGRDVYACSKYNYDASQLHFYVIYDDGNKLVRQGLIYGTIDDAGRITEALSPYAYFKPKKKNEKPQTPQKKVPATQYSAYTAGAVETDTGVSVNIDDFFVRIDKEINELLANAARTDWSFEI
jgi:hypothetical protein